MRIFYSLYCLIILPSLVFAQENKGLSVPTPKINYGYTSKNIDDREQYLIYHHTGGGMAGALYELMGESPREVSSHFLINNEPNDMFKDYIYGLVPENKRAWHAGVSSWGIDASLNASSLGVEIVNLDGNSHEYPEQQVEQIIAIGKYLVEKYNIKPYKVLAHSDIAPLRKDDPGTLFPWERLYQNGIGAWYDGNTIERIKQNVKEVPDIATYQTALKKYGYGVELSRIMDNLTIMSIKAFQRHFRPKFVSGEMDLESYIILLALIEKYK